MKYAWITFFIAFCISPVFADNWIKFRATAIEDAINTMVPETHREAAANEYQTQMDQTTGTISVMGIYKVCAAAGFNINNTNGYTGCRRFINTIAEKSGFGIGDANQQNCKTKFNGIWTLSDTEKQFQCVGRDGHKLVYKKSCAGNGGECIKIFDGLQTQEPNGREFILAYGKQKGLDFTCWYTYDSRRDITSPLGQDYIMCSAGGKAYEFEFDDLIQDPGTKSIESENVTMCEMFGGKIVKHPDSSVEKIWQSCDTLRDICNGPLHNLALSIGHSVMYQGYCRLGREYKFKPKEQLKTLPEVDSYIFYDTGAQMRAGMAKTQTEEYLRTKFPNETYINCDPSIIKVESGGEKPIIEIKDYDYIMTCTVGSKQVDFIFRDLTEGNDTRAAAGMDAMQCIIGGGTFKGEACRGPTKTECNNLDTILRNNGSAEGAYWDDAARTCIMGNAMKAYKRDVATGYVVGAVVVIGGAVFSIATGGAMVPIVVAGAEMLVTDMAFTFVTDMNHRRLSRQAANRYLDFVEDADECTDEKCALHVLQKHYATLSGVMNDLNTDDQKAVDFVMDKLIGLIKTEYVACGMNENNQIVVATAAECVMRSSSLRLIDYIDTASEPVLIVANVLYNPGYVTARFTKIKKLSKIAKLDDAMDVAHMSATDRKFYEAYKKYGVRSESLDAFKARFGGDYSKLDDVIKNQGWLGLDELHTISRQTIDDLDAEFRALNAQADELARTSGFGDTKVRERIQQLRDQAGQVFVRKMNAEAYLDNPVGFSNYRNLDPNVVQMTEDAKKALDIDAIKQDVLDRNPLKKEALDNKYQEYLDGKITIDEYGAFYSKEVLDEAYKLRTDYQRTWNENIIPNAVQLDNKDFVIAERIQLYSEIVDKDPELRRMATNFENLTDSEKVAFGQKILDKSGEYTVSGKYQFKDATQWDAENPDAVRTWSGLHVQSDKTLYVDIDNESSLSNFMNTLAHEDGHKVDAFSPEMGMLGSDKVKLDDVTYSNKTAGGYASTMAERSSYPIGDAVGDDFKRLEQYRFVTPEKYIKSNANLVDGLTATAAAGAATVAAEVEILSE